VINDGTNVINPMAREMAPRISIEAGTPYIARDPELIAGFFDGLVLVEPGVVSSRRLGPKVPGRPCGSGRIGMGRMPCSGRC